MTTTTTPIPYVPAKFTENTRLPDVHSTWKGIERIIPDIIERFRIIPEMAIEFGVWYGYSSAALANYFKQVVGIDTFEGDDDAGHPKDLWEAARRTLAPFPNVSLIQADYRYFWENDGLLPRADLIHIDIQHTYTDTISCGRLACDHSDAVIFHDTESFPEVKKAVADLATFTGRTFYNYEPCYGLGILVREEGR